jgi:membrane-associated phospholipid phosphatase
MNAKGSIFRSTLVFQNNSDANLESAQEAETSLKPVTLTIVGLVFLWTLTASLLNHRGFDYAILHLLNRPAQRSWLLDATISDLNMLMFSSLPIMALLWYVWFSSKDVRRRAAILVGVVLSFGIGTVSRTLQLLLPTHQRPDLDAALYFRVPFAVSTRWLSHWSSFPSDHATVTFALATVVFLMNRRAGRVAYVFAVSVTLARVYAGYHCPTDVIGGAMLGMLASVLAVRLSPVGWVERLATVPPRRAAVFYAVCFYVCFGVTTLFDDYRDLGIQWRDAAVHIVHIARRF